MFLWILILFLFLKKLVNIDVPVGLLDWCKSQRTHFILLAYFTLHSNVFLSICFLFFVIVKIFNVDTEQVISLFLFFEAVDIGDFFPFVVLERLIFMGWWIFFKVEKIAGAFVWLHPVISLFFCLYRFSFVPYLSLKFRLLLNRLYFRLRFHFLLNLMFWLNFYFLFSFIF